MQSKKRVKLQRERERLNLSQEDVAGVLDTTARSVLRWEKGESTPSPYFRAKLCEIFHSKPEELDLDRDERELDDAHYDPYIPLPTTPPLVGREQDLKRIKQHLLSGNDAVVYGLPGVGKSALAVALAYDQDIRNHFSDGILWAGLGLTPPIARTFERWKVLLPPVQAPDTYENALPMDLHMRVAQGHYLIVIDDVWTLEHALALKIGGAHCVHLVTTRSPSIAYGFAFDAALAIEELTEEESFALLNVLAPMVVVEAEERSVTELLKNCGGLPLALVLLGNYLRTQGYSRRRRRIQQALERLMDVNTRLQLEEARGPLELHSSLAQHVPLSLHSIIAVTADQLSSAARNALYALSVFPPKPQVFSEDMALFVAQCSSSELDELVDAGLLYTHETGYCLQPLLADYARRQLHDTEASTRLATYSENKTPKNAE